jgi:CHAD domain-containing protein
VATVREVEDKYTVGTGFAVPDLVHLDGIAAISDPEVVELDATYYDTADFRLVRNKITLRRRSGGNDAGWHLKLPSGGARDEVRRPLGRGAKVPAALVELATSRSRGATLVPVVRMQTRRTLHNLLAVDGSVLAELADDSVRAQVLDPTGDANERQEAEVSIWREVEVELREGGIDVLAAVGAELERAGARPASVGSKVASVLGSRLAAGPDFPPADPLARRTPAGEVIRAYLNQHVEAMVASDPRVRLDEPDSVHKMRVATRRLRSTLRSFRVLLDEHRAGDLDSRLRELAATLGIPRDKEVQIERLLSELGEQPESLVLGPVQRRIEERLGAERRDGHDGVLRELRSTSYARLLDDLLDFVRTGVLTSGPAAKPAKEILPALVRKRYRRLAQRIEHASRLEGADQDVALHSARKAAKRARYAAEALIPVFGDDATGFAERMESVQEVLGNQQDGVVSQQVLRDLALRAQHAPDESAFTYGLLVGVEQARTRDARAALKGVWREAVRKQHRRWLR